MTLGISTAKPFSANLLAMPILPGRGPQTSVRNSTPGNSAMSSGRMNSASAPDVEFSRPGISSFVSFIFLLINHGVTITRLMAPGTRKAVAFQLAPDHPIEIAVRHQGRCAIFLRLGDQDIGGLGGAPKRLARIFDVGMKAHMPKDARDHRPFGNFHAQQGNGGRSQ